VDYLLIYGDPSSTEECLRSPYTLIYSCNLPVPVFVCRQNLSVMNLNKLGGANYTNMHLMIIKINCVSSWCDGITILVCNKVPVTNKGVQLNDFSKCLFIFLVDIFSMCSDASASSVCNGIIIALISTIAASSVLFGLPMFM